MLRWAFSTFFLNLCCALHSALHLLPHHTTTTTTTPPTHSGLPDSSVVKGMVLRRDTEGTIKLVKDAKVAVFAQVRVGVCGVCVGHVLLGLVPTALQLCL